MHDSLIETRLIIKSYCLELLFKSSVSGLDFPIPMQSLQIKLEIPEPRVAGLSLQEGWLVIFDRRSHLPIEERTTTELAVTGEGRTIMIIRG